MFDSAFDHVTVLWNLRSDELAGPLSHPNGLSNYVFYSAFTGPSRSVSEVWIEPTVSGHEGATKTAVVLGTRGADAQWTGPPRIFETASIPLDHLQYAPDEQHLVGWGEAGTPKTGAGFKISSNGKICHDEDCRTLVDPFGGTPYHDLGYVLGGKALIGISHLGAHILTSNGDSLLGLIHHAGDGGWIYVDMAESKEPSRAVTALLWNRVRGQIPVELLQESSGGALRCARGSQIFPWSTCSVRFAKPGALSKRLHAIVSNHASASLN